MRDHEHPSSSESSGSTQERIRRIARIGHELSDAALRQLSVEEERRQNILDLPLMRGILETLRKPDATNDVLWRQGIRTIRDVVVLGPGRLGVSEGPRTRTYQALRDNQPALYDERFQDPSFAPSVEDIATLCYSLEQVHARVLSTYRKNYPRIYRELAYSNTPIIADELRMTVANILDESDPIQIRTSGPSETDLDEDPLNFDVMRREAVEFADTFLQARQDVR